MVPSWEYVLVFCKGSWTLEGNKEYADISSEEFIKYSDAFWTIPPETRGRQPFLNSLYPPRRGRKTPEQKSEGHPAPFPEELIKRLIKFYSYRKNVVIDPFGGTGTVAAIAKRYDRHFVHMDISRKYSSVAAERVSAETRPLVEVPTSDTNDYPEELPLESEEKPAPRGFFGRFKRRDPIPS